MNKKLKWLSIPIAAVLVIGLLLSMFPSVALSEAPTKTELVTLRQENSKTFRLDNGNRQLVISIGAVHYKDNYNNPGEQWKDIDLTWEDNKITKAPYELTLEGNKVTIRNKKSGEISTIELLDIGGRVVPPIPDIAWEKPQGLARAPGTIVLQDIAKDTDLEVVAESGAVRFVRVLKSDKAPKDAKFKVTGNFGVRASDEDGDIPVESSLVDGVLTETLKPDRPVKYPVRIDPTLTIQPSGKDTYLNIGAPTNNQGGSSSIVVRDRIGSTSRTILEFDITGLPAGATLGSANLQLYYSRYSTYSTDTDPSGKTVWTYKLARTDWVELEATWNIYKTGSNWTVAGGDYVIADPVGGSTTFPADFDWMTWDVLAIVQDAYDSSIAAEFLVKFETEDLSSNYSQGYFYSSNYTTDTDYCPQLVITYTVSPTVTAQAVDDISYTTATANGEITDIGAGNADMRGFVWDLATQGAPGDVAPDVSGYANYNTENGDFGTGVFDHSMTGLDDNTTYYVRAWAHNADGYAYSDEVFFDTLAYAAVTIFTYNADIDGTNAILNGEITATGGDVVDYRGFVWNTSTHADPGDTTPGASAYSNEWTETGDFSAETFDIEVTGLTALVTYYYRAVAHNSAGWTYGEELTFFALVDGKVYLEFRPDLDETRIRGNAGIPTDVLVGIFFGYSMPVWNEDDEELYFIHCVPNRWDDNSDPVYGSHILVHIDSSLANTNEEGNSYTLQLAWDHVTPNEEEVPTDASHTTIATRTVYSNTQYECYQDWFVMLYNTDVGDDVAIDDLLGLRIRRIGTEGQKELNGELIIHAVDILYARGDLLGDPEGGILTLINTWISEGLLIGGEDVFFLALILLALGLTISTFALKSGRTILAFASAGAWVILGVYSYTQSTATWDIYYALFWLSMGMVLVCVLVPAVLREKKEEDISADDIDEYGDKDLMADMETNRKDKERFDKLSGSRKQRPRKRLSRFARTGKE